MLRAARTIRATVPPSRRHRELPSLVASGLAALLCAVLAVYLVQSAADEDRLKRANERGAAGDLAGAIADARSVDRAPAAARARLTEAYALLEAGRTAEALKAFAAAARRDRDNWVVHRDWAIALVRAGEVERGKRRMARAAQLNPRLRVPLGFPR